MTTECKHVKADAKKLKYSTAYDAHYCSECKEWLEPTCDMASCNYCTDRPAEAV